MTTTILTTNNLGIAFESARNSGATFLFVKVNAKGTEEVICIPRKSFEAKEAYYNHVYNEDLTHKFSEGVSITGFTHGGPDALYDLI